MPARLRNFKGRQRDRCHSEETFHYFHIPHGNLRFKTVRIRTTTTPPARATASSPSMYAIYLQEAQDLICLHLTVFRSIRQVSNSRLFGTPHLEQNGSLPSCLRRSPPLPPGESAFPERCSICVGESRSAAEESAIV